jgi:hypothetical protein
MRLMDVRGIGADRRMRDFRTTGVDTEFDYSNVREGNEISGANGGANRGRHRATPGHGQPLSVQLDSTSGHVQHRPATARKRLLSSGSQVQVLLGAQPSHAIFAVKFTVREPAGEPIAWRQPWRNGRVFGPAWMGANRTGSAVPARRSGRCRGDALAPMPGGFQLSQTTQLPIASGPELLSASGSRLAEHRGLAVLDRQAGTGGDGALAGPLRSLLLAVRAVRGRVQWRCSDPRGRVLTG